MSLDSPPRLPNARNRFTILVVDDLLPNRLLLKRFLTKAGYDVVEADHGKSALSTLSSSQSIDLVITDVEMPELSGIEMLREIRSGSLNHPEISHLPVLVASGNADAIMERDAMTSGADGFFSKPLDLSQLANTIATCLQGSKVQPAERITASRAERQAQPLESRSRTPQPRPKSFSLEALKKLAGE